jgi:hypothetical protein
VNLWELLAESDAAHDRWDAAKTEEARVAWCQLWSIHITCPGDSFGRRDQRAGPGDYQRCTPTVLDADRVEQDGDLPNWRHYRGACLGCGWAGGPVDSENDAAEDAHDHAWPGWRNLPPVLGPPSPDGSPKEYDKRKARWLEKVAPVFPAGWLEGGGPIRTARKAPGNRHVPLRTPYGGYDLACSGEPEAGQLAMF